MIKANLDVIDDISKKIKIIEAEIAIKVKRFEEDLKIALSVPGVGLISATPLTAEKG